MFRHYSNPGIQYYKSPVGAFGASTTTESYISPANRIGYVKDIEVFLTADAVGTSTVPEVDVGSASGLVEYARFRLGTTAILGLAASSTPIRARSQVIGNGSIPLTNTLFTGYISLETARIPAATVFVITMKAGTGGSPAGTGYSIVTIDWF